MQSSSYWTKEALATMRESNLSGEDAERITRDIESLLDAVQEKRRLQMLDAGTETFMTEKERTYKAARRVGLDVPENIEAER